MLNSLYVLSEDNRLSLDNENVVVSNRNQEVGRFPLHTIEAIFCFSYAGGTPALMGACVEKGITFSMFTPYGKFLARAVGEKQGNVLLRMEQFRIADDERKSCVVGKNFIIGKIYNEKWVIERATRDHPNRIPIDNFKLVSSHLSEAINDVRTCNSLNELQGIEGKAAQEYFSCLDNLILQQKSDFFFDRRNRRPPIDRMNALLSFAYSLLTRDCESALEGVGIDSYVGFIHRKHPGRRSLALDLVEELRACYADRFVLYCINQRIIHADDFVIQESGAVVLSESGRKVFLSEWQKRKKEMLTHPFLGEKISWGLVPHVQALLLARTIRGDLDEYPPFLWK